MCASCEEVAEVFQLPELPPLRPRYNIAPTQDVLVVRQLPGEETRALRRRLADARGVPAFVIFSDATLLAMAAMRPSSPAELLEVPGVGPHKLESYGAAFLAALGQ